MNVIRDDANSTRAQLMASDAHTRDTLEAANITHALRVCFSKNDVLYY